MSAPSRRSPPRFLYHGTSESAARRIVAEGIRPRGAGGTSNWLKTVESNPECVYLTDVYGPYFAAQAAKDDERWAILEVDRRRISLAEVAAEMAQHTFQPMDHHGRGGDDDE